MPNNKTTSKLVLKSARVPLKTCLKLALKNMWKKKFRYLVMLIICSLSLTFLSFTIELNGEKLRENVYTMIENGYRYTEIYEHVPTSKKSIKENIYNKYLSTSLKGRNYQTIKDNISDITIHEYSYVKIPYAFLEEENANYFYTGYINALIKYDPTNNYDLIAGKLPNEEKKEILITDYLVAAFKYFKLYPYRETVDDFLNLRLDLGQDTNYIVVGIIKTNYEHWSKFANIETVKVSDKENYAYTNDFLMMNSVILPETCFNIEKIDVAKNILFSNRFSSRQSLANWKVSLTSSLSTSNPISYPSNNQQFSFGTTYQELNIETFRIGKWYNEEFGRLPLTDDEIVVPIEWLTPLFNISWSKVASNDALYDWDTRDETLELYRSWWNTINGTKITLSLTNSTSNATYEKEYTIVGVTADYGNAGDIYNIPLAGVTKNEFQNIYYNFKEVDEKILVELPNNSLKAYELFNRSYKAGYILNVWAYRSDIDSYVVDPFIDLASKVGLFIFAAFTMAIMWTIISIEIVDSKKEIGILRSIGLNSGKVAFIFIFQTGLVIFLSYFVSIFLSMKLIPLYNSGIMDEYHKIILYMYTFTYRTPLYLAVFVIVMTLISTLIPLTKIMSNKIIDVINERDH